MTDPAASRPTSATATPAVAPPAGARVRPATPADVAAMDAMIHELAAYERSPELALATPEDLHRALFGPDPRVHAHVAEIPLQDEHHGDGAEGTATPGGTRVVGMAIWFVTYSTWTGRQGIWLEDLYVSPAARGAGLGSALLAALAAECTDRGWTRFEWTVLDWNTPAQDVYRAVGAAPQEEWTTWRLDGERLDALAARARP